MRITLMKTLKYVVKAYVLYYTTTSSLHWSICEIRALGPIFSFLQGGTKFLLILDSHEFPVVGSSTRSRSRPIPNHSPPSSFSVRCLQVGRPCGGLATVRFVPAARHDVDNKMTSSGDIRADMLIWPPPIWWRLVYFYIWNVGVYLQLYVYSVDLFTFWLIIEAAAGRRF